METSQIIILIFSCLFTLIVGFFMAKIWIDYRYKKWHKDEKEKMYTIEEALKGFWDHERAKYEETIGQLNNRIEYLEGKVETYRKKASGLGIMGMGKDKKSDMLMSMLMENEALEEKLFKQNLKLHEEREEFLKREVEHISYKKVMLSQILNNPQIRGQIKGFLKDSTDLEKISLPEKESDESEKEEIEKESNEKEAAEKKEE